LKTISGVKWDLTSLKKKQEGKGKNWKTKVEKIREKIMALTLKSGFKGHDCKYCILSKKF
jgi:hypothetical protein